MPHMHVPCCSRGFLHIRRPCKCYLPQTTPWLPQLPHHRRRRSAVPVTQTRARASSPSPGIPIGPAGVGGLNGFRRSRRLVRDGIRESRRRRDNVRSNPRGATRLLHGRVAPPSAVRNGHMRAFRPCAGRAVLPRKVCYPSGVLPQKTPQLRQSIKG